MSSGLEMQLAAAKAKLKAANQEYQRRLAISSDAVDSAPDGTLALQQALALSKAAFREYSKALRAWTESQSQT